MKYNNTCPKCGWRKLAVINSFQQPDHDSANLVQPIPAVTIRVKGFIGDRESHGSLESWMCVRCGYTELYAKGISNFDDLAQRFPDQVRISDASGR